MLTSCVTFQNSSGVSLARWNSDEDGDAGDDVKRVKINLKNFIAKPVGLCHSHCISVFVAFVYCLLQSDELPFIVFSQLINYHWLFVEI